MSRLILMFVMLSPLWSLGNEPVFVPDSSVRRLAVEMDKKYYTLFLESFDWIKTGDVGCIPLYFGDSTRFRKKGAAVDLTKTRELRVRPVYTYGQIVHDPYPVSFPINWKDSANSDLTWQLYFQSLQWLRPMLKSRNQDTLAAAFGVINDWIGQHTEYPLKGEKQAWGDHAPAERLVVFTEALRRFEELGINDSVTWKNLRFSILNHLFFIATLEKYYSWHNHAIIFDEKMITALEILKEFVLREELLNLAFQRMFEQYRFSYTPEGIHREHSPCYHKLFSATLIRMTQTAGRLGIPLPDFIRRIRTNSSAFTTIADKLGSSFPVGDCARKPPADNFRQTGTKTGTNVSGPGLNFSYEVFPLSGWFFAFDTLATVAFCTQSDFHSFSHYQRDETSFILKAGTQELIIDPGLYNYQNSPVYEYYRSSRAHNMLVVDGLPDVFDEKLTGFSGITRYAIGQEGDFNGKAAVELVNPHYQNFGVEIHRQYLFPGHNSILVRDVIESKERHTYRQLFHLWPGARVGEKGSSIEISWENAAYSIVLSGKFKDFRLIESASDPLQGWYFPAFNQMAPAPVLELVLKGKNCHFETLVMIRNNNSGQVTSAEMKEIFKLAGTIGENLEKQPVRELIHEPFPARWKSSREKR